MSTKALDLDRRDVEPLADWDALELADHTHASNSLEGSMGAGGCLKSGGMAA